MCCHAARLPCVLPAANAREVFLAHLLSQPGRRFAARGRFGASETGACVVFAQNQGCVRFVCSRDDFLSRALYLIVGSVPRLLLDSSHTALAHFGQDGTAGRLFAAPHSSVDNATVGDLPQRLLMRSYSSDYFPHADNILYLFGNYSAFFNFPIRFNSRVEHIRRPRGDENGVPKDARFVITTRHPGTNETRSWACHTLVYSVGLTKPNPSRLKKGIEFAETYSTVPTNVSLYRNQRVLILGRGNAAFEIAQNIAAQTAFVHIAGDIKSRVRLAWETHYPGDVRAPHNLLLESYMLKSQDGMLEGPLEDGEIRPTGDGRFWFFNNPTGECKDRCPFRHPYDRIISCPGWQFDPAPFADDVKPVMNSKGKFPAITPRYESVSTPGLFFAGSLMHSMDWKKSAGGFIHGFRYSIRALHRVLEQDEETGVGSSPVRPFPFELRVMAEGVRASDPAGGLVATEPLSSASLDSSSSVSSLTTLSEFIDRRDAPVSRFPFSGPVSPFAPGLCGAGSRDCRSRWPRRRVVGVDNLLSYVFRRLNFAAGIFQMFGTLVDVVLLPPSRKIQQPVVHRAENDVDTIPLDSSVAIGRSMADPFPNATFFVFEEVPLSLVPRVVRQWYADIWGGVDEQDVYRPPIHPSVAVVDEYNRHRKQVLDDILNMTDIKERVDSWTATFYKSDAPAPLVQEIERLEGLLRDAARSDPFVSPRVNWLTISLEFGANASRPGRDPFSLNRANVPLDHPEDSHFLHPVIRLFDSSSTWDSSTRAVADAAASEARALSKRRGHTAKSRAGEVPTNSDDSDEEDDDLDDLELLLKKSRGERVDQEAVSREKEQKRRYALTNPEPLEELHVLEDFLAEWDQENIHLRPMRLFLRSVVAQVMQAEGALEEFETITVAPDGSSRRVAAAETAEVVSTLGAHGKFLSDLMQLSASIAHAWVDGVEHQSALRWLDVRPSNDIARVLRSSSRVCFVLVFDRDAALSGSSTRGVSPSVQAKVLGFARRLSRRYPTLPIVELNIGDQDGARVAREWALRSVPALVALVDGQAESNLRGVNLRAMDSFIVDVLERNDIRTPARPSLPPADRPGEAGFEDRDLPSSVGAGWASPPSRSGDSGNSPRSVFVLAEANESTSGHGQVPTGSPASSSPSVGPPKRGRSLESMMTDPRLDAGGDQADQTAARESEDAFLASL